MVTGTSEDLPVGWSQIVGRGNRMQVVLVMFRGDGERRSFSIVHDVTVIGRREDCDFRIPLGEISRKHCRLIKDGDGLRAEDLGSSNGTFVNGSRVQEAALSPGDTLKVGSVVFVVQIDGEPAESDMKPMASDSALAMSAQSEEDELLTPMDQITADGGVEPSADELEHPTIDEPAAIDGPLAGADDQYDPMSILAADPDASSLGSSVETDDIAEDLLIELESKE
jgi:pSer/pThr/pTyr-binding forkhead associated (FHA) protein